MIWCKLQFFSLLILLALTVVHSQEMHLEEISSFLKSGIDSSTNPCFNFYDYVCGNWVQNNPSRDYFLEWNIHEKTTAKIIHIIKGILEEKYINKDSEELFMEKKYYQACMDKDYSLKEGKNLLLKINYESDRAGANWQNVAKYYASMIGETFLFSFSLSDDNILQILRPYESKTNRDPYEELKIEEINYYLKARVSSGTYDEYRKPFLEFIQNINELVHKTALGLLLLTVEELQETYNYHCPLLNSNSRINWLEFLQKLVEGSGIVLTPSYKILIDDYYLSQLCETLSKTPPFVIVLYLQYHFELDRDTMNLLHQNKKATSFERSYSCIKNMPIASGFSSEIMNNEHFYEREKFLLKVFKHLKSELKKVVENSWINDISKNASLDLINRMKLKFVAINNFKITIMPELNPVSYNFNITPIAFQNLINFKKAQIVHKIRLSLDGNYKNEGKSFNNRRRKRNIDMNALYLSHSNEVEITPAYLFSPIFHPYAPIAYNIGKLGSIIGHEISHSLDFTNLNEYYKDYWKNIPHMSEIYNQKLNCFVNQFDKLNVNGWSTLSENYADTLGAKLAFKVMRQMIDDDPSLDEERLSDFENTDANKLFFISFANNYCEMRKTIYSSNTHSPHLTRIVGTVQNMKEFAETFNCEEGEPMNPKEKCDFWANPNP